MPRFRYEAIDAHGVPIHGTIEAVDVSALQKALADRRQKLVSSTELSLDSLTEKNRAVLPRLYQLRLGEHLREAFLTGLPAHEAVRAVAAEPLTHPVLGIASWLQATAVLVFLCVCAFRQLTGSYQALVLATGILAVVGIPLLRIVLTQIYQSRPRALLRSLADRLEAGHSPPESLAMAMPAELRCVMNSHADDSSKAQVAAELLPSVLGGSLLTQQFVLTLIGPLVMMAVVSIGIYTGVLFVVTKFGRIFDDFGTELPSMTSVLISLGKLLEGFGIGGWVAYICLMIGMVVFLVFCLSSGRGAEFLETLPVVGVAFRWSMQARVSRILSAMIRNNCSYSESLRTATAGSGFQSVRQLGELLATELETRSGQVLATRKLSGLPLSMLFVADSGQNEIERRSALSATFLNLSEMLEAATLGQGRLLSVIVQFFVILFTGCAVAFGVLAMFLPLIKLLNDLS